MSINQQEIQYDNNNNANGEQESSPSSWSAFLDSNFSQTPSSSSTVSYSPSSTMDAHDRIHFDQQVEMSTPTTETTIITAPTTVIDSTDAFDRSPMILDLQKTAATATSYNSNNNYNMDDTIIPQSSFSYINMLHRNSNSVSSFSSSSSSSSCAIFDMPTDIAHLNDSFFLQGDITSSLPQKPDIIPTTINEKGKTNYHQQSIIPLSSCSGTANSSNLNSHLKSNINNNKKSLNQYKNRNSIRVAPHLPLASSSLLPLTKRNSRTDKQYSITSEKHQQHTMKGCNTTTPSMIKRTYERSDPCHECGKTFSRGQDLKRHERSVHEPQRIHQCHKCGQSFPRNDSLLRHERKETDCRYRHRRRH